MGSGGVVEDGFRAGGGAALAQGDLGGGKRLKAQLFVQGGGGSVEIEVSACDIVHAPALEQIVDQSRQSLEGVPTAAVIF